MVTRPVRSGSDPGIVVFAKYFHGIGNTIFLELVSAAWIFAPDTPPKIPVMRKYIFLEIIVALLILLFLYTVTAKLIDFKGFAADLRNQPFPNSVVPFLVWFLPSLELLIILALLFEKSRGAGFLASGLLMSVFTIYTAAVLLHFFPRTPCSCGGVIKKLSWGQHLALNIFYLGISWLGFLLQYKKQQFISNFKFSL